VLSLGYVAFTNTKLGNSVCGVKNSSLLIVFQKMLCSMGYLTLIKGNEKKRCDLDDALYNDACGVNQTTLLCLKSV
jgi:hypothetical protein